MNNEWRASKELQRDNFMTEEEKTRINKYVSEIQIASSRLDSEREKWSEIDKYYANKQDDRPKMPNSKMNIICSTVEGEIAEMLEQDFATAVKAEDPASLEYAKGVKLFLDWTLRKNHFNKKQETHERRRIKFGIGIFKVCFDETAFGGYGLCKLETPSIDKVYFDSIIGSLDSEAIENSEYIYETINMGYEAAKKFYGKEKADSIDYGVNQYWDGKVFDREIPFDSENAWTLIQRWSKPDGILRVEEFSHDGLLLYDSHKVGTRKDNQKNNKVQKKSYYSKVFDRYPYFVTGVYQEESSLYGFGDGELLLPLQKMINNLYDKIQIAARPPAVLVDSNTNVDIDSFDEDSFAPVYYDSSPNMEPIRTVNYGGVNDAWWRLLDYIRSESQRVVRFSDMMIGQSQGGTATEASINQKQGIKCAYQKQTQFQDTIQDVCEYMVCLAQEYHTGKYFSTGKKDEYHYVDLSKDKVRVMKPAGAGFTREYMALHPDSEMPKYEMTDIEKNPEYNIEITIGAGMPKTPSFLYSMVEKLSQMQSIDEQGQPKPVITWQELREFIKTYLGLSLDDSEAQKMFSQPIGAQPNAQQPSTGSLDQMPAQNLANSIKNEGGL
jgi:hypothetical protein